MTVLRAARDVALPDWWVGAGALRDLVWGELHGGFDPSSVRDVDVAFFDPDDLTRERDDAATAALRSRLPDVPWEAKNQAAVHTWYERKFGLVVGPLLSAADGVATWPETATAVAVRLETDGTLSITAVDGGVRDLLDGVCRRNPRRSTPDEYRKRVSDKRIAARWPRVRIIDA
jgi:hypothetical protein